MTDDDTTATEASTDRLYFRQLLAGRDFAQTDQIARQMVNFAYLIGDRVTMRNWATIVKLNALVNL